jgi:hypothetical protein
MGMQCTPIANTRPLLIGVCPPVGDHKKGRFDRMKEITNRSQPQPTLSFQCHKQGYRMTVPLPDRTAAVVICSIQLAPFVHGSGVSGNRAEELI